jgi:hypothetical protein
MEMVGMFYLVSWYARFLKLHTFSRGTNIPLVHPLHGTTKRTYKLWLSKGLNNWQLQTIHTMMQEEGPMLFASGVGSWNGEGWQAETYEEFKILIDYSNWWPRFYTWSQNVQLQTIQ